MKEKTLALKSGTRLQNGRYVISRVIGQGGFGITYEATLTSLDKRVAVKEYFLSGFCIRDKDGKRLIVPINGNQELFERQRKRFHNEADRLAHFSNPYLVPVHDLFEENGTSYYVMDFIEGTCLSNKIEQSHTPFGEKEVLSILDQMLDALNCIHSQTPPLYHLDIKPSNIMVDDNGHAVLIDFGASKYGEVGEGTTSNTSIIYSPGFAPVEQLSGNKKNMGPWTDFYALGATLYTMLTLQKPAEPSDILADKRQDKAQSLPLPPSISPRLRQLIPWMMSFDKSDRPQSVEEIRNWLTPGASSSSHEKEKTVVDNQENADEQTIFPGDDENHSNIPDNSFVMDNHKHENHPDGKQTTILIFIASLLATALLACLGYIFLKKPKEVEPAPKPTEVVEEKNVEEQQPTEPVKTEKEPELQSVNMNMWGYAGGINFNFYMNGTTGSYIQCDYMGGPESGVRRQLVLVSYNPKDGRCVINASLKGKYIGKFDGIFKEVTGEHFIQSYSGKFYSVKGGYLDFAFHYD